MYAAGLSLNSLAPAQLALAGCLTAVHQKASKSAMFCSANFEKNLLHIMTSVKKRALFPVQQHPTLEYEQSLFSQGLALIAGVDEAGRGPLAGPVIVAAVILPKEISSELLENLKNLNDSKKMSLSAREECFNIITGTPEIVWALGEGSVQEIGDLNILRATHLAMRRALLALKTFPEHALVDGLPVRDLPVPQTALVGGDGLSMSIAAASVVAKVTRDRMMEELHHEFPQYGFLKHKGYATAAHLATLREYGPCKYHRRGFSPVDQITFSF